jgi:hypothetical protein
LLHLLGKNTSSHIATHESAKQRLYPFLEFIGRGNAFFATGGFAFGLTAIVCR